MAANSYRAALLCIMLAGCTISLTPMTSQEIAAKLAECEKYNLKPVSYLNGLNMQIVEIQCQPKN